MSITATELKQNLSKYLLLAASEDVLITKNGKVVAKLSNPYTDKLNIVESLKGIIPNDGDVDLKKIRNERLTKI